MKVYFEKASLPDLILEFSKNDGYAAGVIRGRMLSGGLPIIKLSSDYTRMEIQIVIPFLNVFLPST